MAVLKLIPRGIPHIETVRIDPENIGQLASTLVAALTSHSTRFKTRSADLADALRVGTTWSSDGVIIGIQDFIILTEMGSTVRKPFHVDLLGEVCLSSSTLSSMSEVALVMTIAHYTRITLSFRYHAAETDPKLTARQLVRQLIDDVLPSIFLQKDK